METNRGAALGSVNRFDGKFTGPVGNPVNAFIHRRAGPAGKYLDLVGNDEGGIKPDPELADQVRVFLRIGGHRRQIFTGPGTCDCAKLLNDIIARHADAIIGHTESFGFGIEVDTDPEVSIVFQKFFIRDRLEAQFIGCVRGI